MRLPMIQQAVAAFGRNCIWVSPLAGFLVTVPLFWIKKRFLPFYLVLKADALQRSSAAWRLLACAALEQVAVVAGSLVYLWVLERWFGARGLFDMIPGYSTCALLYVGGLVLGMAIVPRLLGVPLGWPADNASRQ